MIPGLWSISVPSIKKIKNNNQTRGALTNIKAEKRKQLRQKTIYKII